MGGFNNFDKNLTNKQKPGKTGRSAINPIFMILSANKSIKKYNLLFHHQVSLGEDLAAALADGVVLCHIANHVSPRAVSSIHVPSPAVVSLSCSLTPM